MKKSYDVQILGQEFSVLSDSGDDHVAKVVQYVNNKVEEIDKNAKKPINTLSIAILAALNIADEYFKMIGSNDDICHQLEDRSKKLIGLIDEVK
ncbi:MAG: cell division protein ZapA [Syntrophales bacterium]